ncbi:MAG: precorrin-3B C(17)-methyltransferase [Magnetococcales bacterium]|nr:precorrin-3B C(17)-methyltransferase [Magnetococcales bacterium]
MSDGKRGSLSVVGLGPGAVAQMTARAREVIAAAEIVIGYKTYLRLVADLLTGKEVIASPMRAELERCAEACRLAMAGRRVVLVSSGDAGIYGMAGPLLEMLLHAGWQPDGGVRFDVVPGVTALSACAALVGAPLTHDFCAISLSDLLTPWPRIEKRLEAAAAADFVTALYNPRSGRRTWQIERARSVFLRHRAPATPVALVTAAYRETQAVILTTLATMDVASLNMQSTVLIGNQRTFVRAGLMITPRGYTDKYDLDDHLVAGDHADPDAIAGADSSSSSSSSSGSETPSAS